MDTPKSLPEGEAISDGKTSAAVIADLVAKHVRPRILKVEDPATGNEVPVIILPTSLEAQAVEELVAPYRSIPTRKKGTATLVDLESFIAFVNRCKTEHSALFADPGRPSLRAVFDYNEPGEGAPAFGEHRAVYTFPVADEWTAWNANNGKWMKQAEFAAFIDDRLLDVAPPDEAFSNAAQFMATLGITSFASPSRLMQLSRGLTVHVEDRTTQKIDPNTGEATMHFEVSNSDADGAPLAVPRAFILQIPVFRDGAAYRFPVRLKYRAGGGTVTWSYEIHDPRRAFDDAIKEACTHAKDGTELPLFYGAPEV